MPLTRWTLEDLMPFFKQDELVVSGEPSGFGWVYACPFALVQAKLSQKMERTRQVKGVPAEALVLVVRARDSQQNAVVSPFEGKAPVKPQKTTAAQWKNALKKLPPRHADLPVFVAYTEAQWAAKKPATHINAIANIRPGKLLTLCGLEFDAAVEDPKVLFNLSRDLTEEQVERALLGRTYDLPAGRKPKPAPAAEVDF